MDSIIQRAIEDFFGKYTKIKFKKGEVIIRAEDAPQGVFYLKRGFVRQYLVGSTGTMLMLQIYKPNAFFPMTWAVNDTPNIYCFEAMSNVEVWRAPKDAVREFLRHHPEVVYNFSSRLLSGVSGIMKRMEYLVMEDAYSRTILLLLYLAMSLGEKENGDILLPVPVTHREIAAWIGTTRETASLQVERLKKSRLIVYRKRQLIIPSLKMLEKELAGN